MNKSKKAHKRFYRILTTLLVIAILAGIILAQQNSPAPTQKKITLQLSPLGKDKAVTQKGIQAAQQEVLNL